MLDTNEMLRKLEETLSTPEGRKEAYEYFHAKNAEKAEIPKGWVSIEEHLPMWLAKDFMKGGSKYKIKFDNGNFGTATISDHNVWYFDAKALGITHWWNV